MYLNRTIYIVISILEFASVRPLFAPRAPRPVYHDSRGERDWTPNVPTPELTNIAGVERGAAQGLADRAC